ncbi:MAG TPA: hypothetical protein DEQ02_07220 [Ruminococcaceae bacterium]|nr:hypothetical protein [Oscillospiraceae bacterium]
MCVFVRGLANISIAYEAKCPKGLSISTSWGLGAMITLSNGNLFLTSGVITNCPCSQIKSNLLLIKNTGITITVAAHYITSIFTYNLVDCINITVGSNATIVVVVMGMSCRGLCAGHRNA